LRRHIAPEFRRNDPGLPFEVRGPEGVTQLVGGFRSGIPDGVVMSGWRPFGNVIVDDVWA